MPLYEYRCADCGQITEVIQKFSDDPLSVCSDCGGPIERLLSAPAIQFKGSGWYVNDYAKKSNGGGAPTRSAETTETKETTAKKSESSTKASEKVN